MTSRTCDLCAQTKPFDPSVSMGKARGFCGSLCWECHSAAQNRIRKEARAEARARSKALVPNFQPLLGAWRCVKMNQTGRSS